MRTQTKLQLIEFIEKNGQSRPQQLIEHLGITRAAIHRHLKALVSQGILEKVGTPPRVFYRLLKPGFIPKVVGEISEELIEFLEDRYLYVTPEGHLLSGLQGFGEWAHRTHQERKLPALISEYRKVRLEADGHFKNKKWITATHKIEQTFPNKCLVDTVLYEDFYSLPKFGKTKKGQRVLHAKQGQKLSLIRELVRSGQSILRQIIKEFKIDAVGWIPHSIPRELQFLKEYRKEISLTLPVIEIVKAYSGEVPVAQKSLSKLEERIGNAQNTIFLKDQNIPYKRVLLIDDAIGSGATMNEVAKKLKRSPSVKDVTGFAIVGSLKGFEVLREV